MENTIFSPKFTVERNPQKDIMEISLDRQSAALLIEATGYDYADITDGGNLRMLQACREILRKLAFASLNVKLPDLEDPSQALHSLIKSI